MSQSETMDLLLVAADMRASGDVEAAAAVVAEAAPDYAYLRRTRQVRASRFNKRIHRAFDAWAETLGDEEWAHAVARLAGMRIDPASWWRIAGGGPALRWRELSDSAGAMLYAYSALEDL